MLDDALHTLVAVLSIVVIDLTLSGDNAIVIGMAAHRLPPRQRKYAIMFGAGGAIVLRVTFTFMAAILLGIPLLRAGGGLILVWIAYKLLREEAGDESGGQREATSLLGAIRIIILADVVMSLDNILAVGGASHGNLELLMFGLLLSMSIVMLGSGILAALMSRMGWLVYVGAGVLAWTSAQMILEDEITGRYLPQGELWVIVFTLLIIALLALLTLRGRWARSKMEEPGEVVQASSPARGAGD